MRRSDGMYRDIYKVEKGKMLVVCVNFDFKLLLLHFIVVLLDINTL